MYRMDTKKKFPINWRVGYSHAEEQKPEKYVSATVPGAVQLDWAKAHDWENYIYADNFKQYGWMEDVWWTYRTELSIPPVQADEGLFLVCGGVDYSCKILLNGNMLYEQEGMFTGFEVELTNLAKDGDLLEIMVLPVPKRPGASVSRQQADQCCKPAVCYGWDWHPRLIPLGIWEETFLEVRPKAHIKDSEVFYFLDSELEKADIKLEIALSQKIVGKIVWSLYNWYEEEVFVLEKLTHDGHTFAMGTVVENPELWWPNGQGEQVLYTSMVELYDNGGRLLDQKVTRVGFRTVRLVMHPGAWGEPVEFPKGRSNPPITMEINHRQIFCKGTNWVNPEIFPGTITEDTYKPLVRMAREANMNIFRSWGGGIINKESFFDLCDEMGIMVWQEFPLACNNYVGTEEYLKVLDRESKAIIKRIRSHACLALWCGGNELFNSWSRMTDQSLALRLLNKNCYELDPKTPFIMTSPLMGMAHGNYVFRYSEGEEVYQAMVRAKNTAYTEFGCPGPSPVDYIKSFMPENELFPPKLGTAWETHHGLGAWGPERWLEEQTLEHYFGPANSLEELVERGQFLQCEGYKCIFEEARRQKPRCSMALNWCYNEAWPTAANNSLINWPVQPKPAYFAVKASCRPVLASARISKFSWEEGEVFNPEMWLLSDLPETIPPGRIEAWLEFEDGKMFLLGWDFTAVDANTNREGPVIRSILPHRKGSRMKLKLRFIGHEEWDSEYVLPYRAKEGKIQEPKVRMLNM